MVPPPHDLILSSGFLAFARHVGVVQALAERGCVPAAVVGTSSGAVVGALTCAGVAPPTILDELTQMRPLQAMRVNPLFWRGLFTAPGLRSLLERHLPPRFEDLAIPLAVGVVGRGRAHRLLTSGPLVDAVLASCAMPWVFEAVDVGGERLADGGAADRLGLAAWRAWRPDKRAWVHQVKRTAGVDVDGDRSATLWIETPRSGATFWSLGDVRRQAEEARTLAAAVLAA